MATPICNLDSAGAPNDAPWWLPRYAAAVEPIALAAAAIKVSLFVEALLFALTASRSMTRAVPSIARRCAGEARAAPSSAAEQRSDQTGATNEPLRCGDGEERFPTIKAPYGDGSFPCCRDARQCRTNSDTCRNKTAAAPPRDKAINSISVSMNESD
jgi:hypothetical protein